MDCHKDIDYRQFWNDTDAEEEKKNKPIPPPIPHLHANLPSNYAAVFNERGKDAFQRKDYNLALENYKLGLLNTIPIFEKYKGLLHANIAACYLEMKKYETCISQCNVSLKYDSTYNKAIFRRAKAKQALGLYMEAYYDYSQTRQYTNFSDNMNHMMYVTRLRHNALISAKETMNSENKNNCNDMKDVIDILKKIKEWKPSNDDNDHKILSSVEKVLFNKDLLINIFRLAVPNVIHGNVSPSENDGRIFRCNLVSKYWYNTLSEVYNHTNFLMLHSLPIGYRELLYIGMHYELLSELNVTNATLCTSKLKGMNVIFVFPKYWNINCLFGNLKYLILEHVNTDHLNFNEKYFPKLIHLGITSRKVYNFYGRGDKPSVFHYDTINITLPKLQHLSLSYIWCKDVLLLINCINEYCYALDTLLISGCEFCYDENNLDVNEMTCCLFAPNLEQLEWNSCPFNSLRIDAPRLKQKQISFHYKCKAKDLRFIEGNMIKYKPFSVYRAKYMKYIGKDKYKKTMVLGKRSKT